MDCEEAFLSEEQFSKGEQDDKLASSLKGRGSNETAGETTSCIQLPLNDAEPCAKDCFNQTVDGDSQGLIRLYKLQRLAQKNLVSTKKTRSRWLCPVSRCKRQSNFLNLNEEEMQFKFEALVIGEQVPKDLKTRKTLDASMWHYSKFRSTVWGHLNADEEDGSQVVVKDLEKWHSHDVLYNTKCDDSKLWKEISLRGKHIVPNQGKGWSFREKHEGKGKVNGLPCMTQPKLQLYYI